jgi:NADH dehydrogenase [ubiquinone] 1 alpha subcomplex assembly factor 1
MTPPELRFDSAAALAPWQPVNDGVMGGRSHSRLRMSDEGHAVFEGVVSLENGGGFASIRATTSALAAPGIVGYRITVRGDGKRYKFNLRTEATFDGVNYQAEFFSPMSEWATLDMPLAAFVPSYRGRVVLDAPALDPATVRQVGWMIAARQAGPFQLSIRSIHALF